MNYKVLLIGDSGSGKSTLINKYKTGKFEKRYTPTIGIEVHPLVFHTNKGIYTLNIWDITGQETHRKSDNASYCNADAAIIMFSLDSLSGYKSIQEWVSQVRVYCGNIPIYILGNKVDLITLQVSVNERSLIGMTFNCEYSDYSVKSGYNLEKPFLSLIRSWLLLTMTWAIRKNR